MKRGLLKISERDSAWLMAVDFKTIKTVDRVITSMSLLFSFVDTSGETQTFNDEHQVGSCRAGYSLEQPRSRLLQRTGFICHHPFTRTRNSSR